VCNSCAAGSPRPTRTHMAGCPVIAVTQSQAIVVLPFVIGEPYVAA
jgi:hypothetical protein